MIRILIVEDERPIANLIDWNLTSYGYSCQKVYDGLAAADLILENSYDLILLDIMLPGVDGYSLLEQIKPTGTPVIFLTAKGSVADRVQGSRAGADDYLVKPFEIVELLARVETVFATGGEKQRPDSDWRCDHRRELDAGHKSRGAGGADEKEFDLLLLFARNQNMALFRESIYERVWEAEYTGDSRTVDLHVQRLRKKLGWQNQLTAVYKVGYRLEVKA